jgi:hypothetical protein
MDTSEIMYGTVCFWILVIVADKRLLTMKSNFRIDGTEVCMIGGKLLCIGSLSCYKGVARIIRLATCWTTD